MSHIWDYTGFTYDGVHSRELNIYRVSEGDRYSLPLVPTLEDMTVNVPGGDGQYFFGTLHRGQTLTIQIAFDELLEEDIRKIQTLFNTKKISELIFDEVPYKTYMVKPTGNFVLKYVAFDEKVKNILGEKVVQRVYKGEGTISLTAFTPYARSRFKWKEHYIKLGEADSLGKIPEWKTRYGNRSEWIEASGIVNRNMFGSAPHLDEYANKQIPLYNPGDIPSDFTLTLEFPASGLLGDAAGFSISIDGMPGLFFKQIVRKTGDGYIRINTKLGLVEGMKNDKPSGNVYNEYITKGSFFKIPCGHEKQYIDPNKSPLANLEAEDNVFYGKKSVMSIDGITIPADGYKPLIGYYYWYY